MRAGAGRATAGYEDEFSRALAFLARCPVLLVEGLEGAGKTAFLDRLAAAAPCRNRRPVVRLACEPGATADALARDLLARLAALPPAGSPGGEDVGGGTGAPPAAARPIDGIVSAIEARDVLVLIDDLDALGLDPASALAAALAGRPMRSRAVLSSTRRLRLPFPPQVDCPRVVLKGLEREATAGLIEDLFARSSLEPPPRALACAVHDRTGGHPLAVKLLAGDLVASGGAAAPLANATDLPGGTLAAWTARAIGAATADLGPLERELLAQLAVLRLPVPPSCLASLGLRGDPEAALRSLVERFLVVPAGDRLAVHALVRDAAAGTGGGTAPPHGLHAAAARALRTLAAAGEPRFSAEAVHHLLRAGEPAEALELLGEALPDLRRAGLSSEALALARAVAAAPGGRTPEALLVEADLLLQDCHLDEADAAIRALAPLAAGRPDLGPRVRAAEGRLLLARGRWEEAGPPLREAIAGFEAAGGRARAAETVAYLAHAQVLRWKTEEAAELSRRALALLEGPGDRPLEALLLRRLGDAHHAAGELGDAEWAYERAMRLHEETGDRPSAAHAARQLALVRSKLGSHDEAVALCERAIEHVREAGDRVAEATILEALAKIHLRAGRADRALPFYERALEAFERLGHAHGCATSGAGLGQCRAELGDLRGAELALRGAAERFERLGGRHQAYQVMTNLAMVRLLLGRHAEALALLDRCLEHLAPDGTPEDVGVARGQRALALGRLDRLREAREDALEGLRVLRGLGLASHTAWALLVVASVERRLGALDEAAARAREALDLLAAPGADRLYRIAGRVLLDAVEAAGGSAAAPHPVREPGGPGRRPWLEELLSSPPGSQDTVIVYLRLLDVPLPLDFRIRTGEGDRQSSVADILAIRRRPEAFELVIDVPACRVYREGRGWIDLERRRLLLHLLSFLAARPGRRLSHEAIFRGVWGPAPYDPYALRQVVRFNVRRLRALIEPDPRQPSCVRSVPGARGYRFDAPARYALCLPAREPAMADLSPRRSAILDLLEEGAELATRECARRFRTSRKTAFLDLEGLVRSGHAVRVGRGAGTRYRLGGG